MKKRLLILQGLIAIFLHACAGGQATPAPTSDQIEPLPTAEVIEVNFEPQPGETKGYIDGTTLVYIPAGEFIMGTPGGVDNLEQIVQTNGFWIYSNEVTNSQYGLCAATGECTIPNLEENLYYTDSAGSVMPVTGVTHEQAQTYCGWVNGRLPTEAEWEKTARGPNANVFPWGDDDPSCDKTSFKSCQDIAPSSVLTHPAGQSFYQVFDMAGNVFEWVADWYDTDAYLNGPPDIAEYRVIRGGSFKSPSAELETFQRFYDEPDNYRDDLGFRCVLEDPSFFAPMCVQGTTEPSGLASDCRLDLELTANYCSLGKPYANVAIDSNEDIGALFTAGVSEPGECNFLENPIVCKGPELTSFTVHVAKWCRIDSNDFSCPDGYLLDENIGVCTYQGSQETGGSCPVGYVFDTETKCCTAQTNDFPVCPAGYFYDNVMNACRNTASDTVRVDLGSCTIKNDDDEPSGCTLTINECPSGVNLTNCSCYPAPQ